MKPKTMVIEFNDINLLKVHLKLRNYIQKKRISYAW